MNLYKVQWGKVAGSGFIVCLVMADSEELAELEIRRRYINPLGLSVEKIDIYGDSKKCVVEIINYDDPTY